MGVRDDPNVLNDTPHWRLDGRFDNRQGTERSLGFCDPFGYEQDDMRVMGGTHPASAEKQWARCENYAQGRYRMTCVNGHSGYMRLCYGHVWQITQSDYRKANGLCPRCAWPPRARELEERMNWLMRQLGDPFASLERKRSWAQGLEDAQAEMTELWQRGTIKTGAPLRLEEVS